MGLLAVLLASLALPVMAQNLAVVNGKPIPSSRADALIKQMASQGQPDTPQLRAMVREELVNREVLMQEADRRGVSNTAEVKNQMDMARQSIVIRALIADFIKKNPVSDADIKAEYDKAKSKAGDKEYHAHHILVDKEEDAKSIIAKDYRDFEVTQSERTGMQVLRLGMTPAKLAEIREYSIKQNLTTVRNRVNELGVSEPLVQRQGANRIVVELPGVQDTAEAKRILGKTANLEFRLAAEPDAIKSATETFEFREPRRPPVALERSVIITGDQVTDASASFDENGRPQVNIRLDGHGGELMNRATRNNVGRSMAVVFIEQKPITRYAKQVVDGVEQEVAVPAFKEEKKIISLATIQSALGNQFRITGLDGPGESSELALLLRAGGLAAPMYFAEERTIGPSLGADNIAKGIDASLWGMVFVSLFIIVIYRFFGVIATVALAFNMVLLVALMSILGATLTLPGIAGIVLTMGMAVDANVLIFSRIREELAGGMSVQRAIHEGFNRAFTAIVDANLTSLLVGGILYAMGTGPVKGFAVTMSLGIITSMFTAILVTRAMVNLIFGGRDFKKLWI